MKIENLVVANIILKGTPKAGPTRYVLVEVENDERTKSLGHSYFKKPTNENKIYSTDEKDQFSGIVINITDVPYELLTSSEKSTREITPNRIKQLQKTLNHNDR